jgi:hypothetical protein
MATSGDRYLATSGDFFMATDNLHNLARWAKACKIPRTTPRNFYRISTLVLSRCTQSCKNGRRF